MKCLAFVSLVVGVLLVLSTCDETPQRKHNRKPAATRSVSKPTPVTKQVQQTPEELLNATRAKLVAKIKEQGKIREEMLTLNTFAKDAMTPALKYSFEQQLLSIEIEIQSLQAEIQNLMQIVK